MEFIILHSCYVLEIDLKNKFSTQSHVKLNFKQNPDEILSVILQKLYSDNPAPVLIAIGGPGGTGKSTFAEKLASRLPGCNILSLDNYKTSRQDRLKKKLSGPHPDANQIELLKKHLSLIRSGKPVDVPVYCRKKGDTGSYYSYKPEKLNLIEGEISTYIQFRKFIDFSIFIDSDIKTQLKTRLTRDVDIRGYSYEKAIHTFLASNLVEFSRYGSKSKIYADVHLYCHDDYHLAIEAVAEKQLSVFQQYDQKLQPLQTKGCIVPITTPFNENGSVCETAFVNHLEWLSDCGIIRILVGGTTGEFFSMPIEERLTLLKLAKEFFPGLVLFQAGCDNLFSTLDTIRKAEQLGADTILCLPPYYFKDAPGTGLVKYFNTISRCCTVPLILYNFPLHTGNTITHNILEKVDHFGLKDSSGNLDLINKTQCYLTGGDSLLIESYKKGASGFICSMSNVVPDLYVKLEYELDNNNYDESLNILTLIKKMKESVPEKGIPLIKKLLSERINSYPPHVRPPLIS